MPDNNFDIMFKDNFKLYVLQKDKIIFESELTKNDIPYYFDLNEQPSIEDGIRYFLLDSDSKRIDNIIIENEIIAHTETVNNYDYRDQAKFYRVYSFVLIMIIGILFLIFTIEYLIGT